MSTWTTIRDDVEAPFEKVLTFVEGTTLGQQLEADVKAALAEVGDIAAQFDGAHLFRRFNFFLEITGFFRKLLKGLQQEGLVGGDPICVQVA